MHNIANLLQPAKNVSVQFTILLVQKSKYTLEELVDQDTYSLPSPVVQHPPFQPLTQFSVTCSIEVMESWVNLETRLK